MISIIYLFPFSGIIFTKNRAYTLRGSINNKLLKSATFQLTII